MVFACKFQIKKVKRAVKKMLAEGKIDYSKTVCFSKSEIRLAVWVEPREFRLNGVMYDIYLTDTLENDLVYHCFEDQNESAWTELLFKTYNLSEPLKNNRKNEQNPLNYLMKDITIVNNYFGLWNTKTQENKEDIFFKNRVFTQYYHSKIYTPPDSYCS